jgi:AcrR family transcriptional regulator
MSRLTPDVIGLGIPDGSRSSGRASRPALRGQHALAPTVASELDARSTRDKIFASALRLFANKGYGSVGIREIAFEANVSSAVLYYHAKSKHDLLLQLMSDRLGRITRIGKLACEGLERPEEQLVALVRVHVLSHALHPDEVIDNELSSLDAGGRRRIVALRDEYESLWTAILARGATPPAVFHLSEPKLTRLGLLEMCNGVARWYSSSGERTASEIADHFAGLALTMTGAHRQRHPLRLKDVAGPSVTDCARLVEGEYDV